MRVGGLNIITTCMGQNMTLAQFAKLAFYRAQYGYADLAALESASL